MINRGDIIDQLSEGYEDVLSPTNARTIWNDLHGYIMKKNILDDAEIYGGFLTVELFRIYGEEDIDILGDVFNSAIINYIENIPEVFTNKIHSNSVQEFILFGDPSLKIGGYQ